MLVFKSTAFHPIPKWHDSYANVTCQNQCIASGLPVFVRDVGNKSDKAYIGCGYEHFCLNHYANPSDRTRHMYELLQMNKPTKIYIDFDHYDTKVAEAFTESTNNYIKAVLKTLSKLTNLDVDIPFYILDATTDKKLSKHVIFECYLENIKTVETFIHYVLETTPCEYLDLDVYTSNRLFRMLYSYKANKSIDSALSVAGDNSNEYNPFSVFKSLIQAMMPVNYEGPLASIKDDVAHSVTIVSLTTVASKNGYRGNTCHDVPYGLDDFIGEFSDKGVVLTYRENDTFISCVVGNKRCPWTQCVHTNNNQYFTICKATMRGWFSCADTECTRVQYGHVDVSCLWRDKEIEII
jgi:hypothetical protein